MRLFPVGNPVMHTQFVQNCIRHGFHVIRILETDIETGHQMADADQFLKLIHGHEPHGTVILMHAGFEEP